VAADKVNHAQGFFAGAAVAFDEQVNGVVLIDVLEDAVKGQHIVAADAAAIAVPIAKQRAVEVVFKFGEDFLCFGKQSRRLYPTPAIAVLSTRLKFGRTAKAVFGLMNSVKQ